MVLSNSAKRLNGIFIALAQPF